MKRLWVVFICLLISGGLTSSAAAPVPAEEFVPDTESGRVLGMNEFIRLAAENDTVFEAILLDQLLIQYRKDLALPVRDIILSVRSEYDFVLIRDQDAPAAVIGLSKLFPYTGTLITAEYASVPDFQDDASDFSRLDNRLSEYTVRISQPIAENAFGKATRLLDKIVGIENEVIRHQVIEAYEDYFARLLTAYLDWYEAYENLKVAKSSYRENLRLLENVKERSKSNVALPVDVNKITLQVLVREEVLIQSRVRYRNALNFIRTAIRYEGDEGLIPSGPELYNDFDPDFMKDYQHFREESRTYDILKLLEKKSSLEVERDANLLLPSINLTAGISSEWRGTSVKKEENFLFAGISMDWPIPGQVERAEYETSKIEKKRAELATVNTHYRLYTDLRNLYQQIERERRLIAIAEKKIELAQSIFDDEAENYTFGRITLNDYIDAVNDLDNSRFDRVFSTVQLKKLVIEALRLMDRLVSKETIENRT